MFSNLFNLNTFIYVYMFLSEISLLQKKGDVTINASLVTLPVSLFGHKIKLLLFTECIVHMS